MLVFTLLGCSHDAVPPDGAACDARTLAEGEVRARQIPCSDELIDGGEGRIGDWVIENAYARYVIRGTYAALTRLGQEGGTIIDAAAPGGQDLLLEYLPDGDRTDIVAENDGDEARLVLPGFTYRLGADDDVLLIDGASSGTLQGVPGVLRTGTTLAEGSAFFGLDGHGASGGSSVPLADVTRAAVSPRGLWPDGAPVSGDVDADTALVLGESGELYRAPIEDGHFDLWLPTGSIVNAEREGCSYGGLELLGCGWLHVRVADDAGNDIPAALTDGRGMNLAVPKGGGIVPVGPGPRRLWLWAGPRYSVAELQLPGGDVDGAYTLTREITDDDAVLAALAVEVAPDASSDTTAAEAANELASEGVDFAVLLADDEVPSVSVDEHDAIVAVAGSRAGNVVWSWPWTRNAKRPAHGAVPWDGLGALDLLAATEGGQSGARLTVVEHFWVERARIEADPQDWDPRPDAFWLIDPTVLGSYLALLDDWVDITPVADRTWIEVGADRNQPAYEAGIVDNHVTAGNGPRLKLTRTGASPGGVDIDVRLLAPRWMGMHTVTLWTNLGSETRPVEGAGEWKWSVPPDAKWVVAAAEGRQARPGNEQPAWAVSSPLWLVRP